ncbi:SDR family NAD(P)-dependent oxidoreductase [Natronorubrum texcoconense]|uniref:Meso-butanediol dehydrogenase / (S,S)-butanediol dehydrogenase / diacetyl reductase n=1 Tax=Natronorubrum texcoconense TaxID=1095776 RepID=A0A1G8XJY4_9EURY|nr:SDR family NAD(P)-dependent oxidoreductase [Natronorubrum texcoconense]SDJ90756.1 meso-butanediol dehydrogenase / (S,S)-butanediol dehydrogenase / diacetyl reductase [Natronorubrum texcoconense]
MLDNKIAIVTGGAVGIGKAIAERFVEDGATVVIADIDEDEGSSVAEDIGCRFVGCDVRDYEQVQALVEGTADEFGGLDVIVNNAGIASVSSVEEMDLEEWKAVVETNLDGVMHGTKAALPHLKESDGCIINLGSIYGLVGGKGAASYSAAKGGVVNFTQQVAIDYADQGVRVNSICPGFVETPMTKELLESERFYSFIEQKTPMDRHGQPEEIAPVAAFLASDGASYITGANIPVDGGWTAF